MLDRLAFWAMLPVSAVQGLWLRRVATRLPGAPGPRSGAAGSGEPFHLLMIGDSIIEGVGIDHMDYSLPAQFATELADACGREVRWRAEGRSGDAVLDVIKRLRELEVDHPPDLVLVSVGVNDVTGLTPTRRWRSRLAEMLTLLQRRWPNARVLFAGLPPMGRFPLPPQPLRFSLGLRASTLDRIAADLIEDFSPAAHIPTSLNPREHPFCDDGFHPSAESCTLWAKGLADIESRRESI
jgi:lysophospholipase L1-like esterase